jgi:transposase-like protein
LLERDGELRAGVVPDLKAKTLKGAIRQNVAVTATVITDEHRSYLGLGDEFDHHAVNHAKEEYVRDYFVHINGIEGAWSLFKRQVYGIHHHVSRKHLDAYLGEMCYRYNRRDMGEGDRVNDLLSQVEGRLTYKALTHDRKKAPEAAAR